MSTAVTLSVTAVALAGMPLKVGMLLASAARSLKSTRVSAAGTEHAVHVVDAVDAGVEQPLRGDGAVRRAAGVEAVGLRRRVGSRDADGVGRCAAVRTGVTGCRRGRRDATGEGIDLRLDEGGQLPGLVRADLELVGCGSEAGIVARGPATRRNTAECLACGVPVGNGQEGSVLRVLRGEDGVDGVPTVVSVGSTAQRRSGGSARSAGRHPGPGPRPRSGRRSRRRSGCGRCTPSS